MVKFEVLDQSRGHPNPKGLATLGAGGHLGRSHHPDLIHLRHSTTVHEGDLIAFAYFAREEAAIHDHTSVRLVKAVVHLGFGLQEGERED